MPETWIDEHVGDEARPRPEFAARLAHDLHRGRRRYRRGPVLVVAAAAAAVVAVLATLTLRDRGTTPVDTVPATTEPTPPQTPTTLPTTTTDPTTTTESPTTLAPALSDEAGFVATYLTALAEERWTDAARLLSEGGLELEARSDVRPLYRAQFGLVAGNAGLEQVAAALQRWCATALCDAPEQVADDGTGSVVATWRVGNTTRSATFAGWTFEGSPGVHGLPLQLPPGVDAAGTVPCPSEGVTRQVFADLDGDGWLELLVVQSTGDGADGTPFRHVVSVCGSVLRVEPLELTDGEGVWMYVVNPTNPSGGPGDPDLVLIGSVPPYPGGLVYRLDGTALVPAPGPDGPAPFALLPPFDPEPGHSIGCVEGTADSGPALVSYDYRFVGGTSLETATRLDYTGRDVFDAAAAPLSGSIDLPAGIDAALAIVNGVCHGLPLFTG